MDILDEKPGTKPTLIVVESASGLRPNRATTEAATKTDDSVAMFGPMKYHEGSVTWTVRLEVPKTAPAGEYPIRGLFGYQSCEYHEGGNNVCELPQAVRFAATLTVADEATDSQAATPIAFSAGGSYPTVAELPEAPDLAVVVVPAAYVAQTLEECGRKGVRAAVVIASVWTIEGHPGRPSARSMSAATEGPADVQELSLPLTSS